MESIQKERKQPYNPYPLAGGNAAKAMPDKKAADVFQRLCVHTDFLGTTTVSILTLMEETRLSHGSVVSAIKALKEVGRIAKAQRGRLGAEGGRQTAITRVFCTKEELLKAGVTDENFYSRGGKDGVIDLTLKPSQKPKSSESKVKSKRAKSQTGLSQKPKSFESKATQVGLEPLESEPSFLPLEAEPLESRAIQSNPTSKPRDFDSFTKEGKENQSQHRERQGTPSLPTDKRRLKVPPPNRIAPVRNYLKDEPAAKLRDAGCPEEVIAGITKLEFWSGASNETSNPITAYVTLAMKENGPANRFSRLWMPKLKANGVVIHDDSEFVTGITEADMRYLAAERARRSPEECERDDAMYWWALMEIPERNQLVADLGLEVRRTDRGDYYETNMGDVALVYRAFHEAKAKVAS